MKDVEAIAGSLFGEVLNTERAVMIGETGKVK